MLLSIVLNGRIGIAHHIAESRGHGAGRIGYSTSDASNDPLIDSLLLLSLLCLSVCDVIVNVCVVAIVWVWARKYLHASLIWRSNPTIIHRWLLHRLVKHASHSSRVVGTGACSTSFDRVSFFLHYTSDFSFILIHAIVHLLCLRCSWNWLKLLLWWVLNRWIFCSKG